MVATAHHDATQAGISILRAGGNAVDAAIAVAYALAVVDPCCGNVGGGGFMLIRLHDGRERFLDFRETAPLRATPTMFLDRYGNVRTQASRKGLAGRRRTGNGGRNGDGATRARNDVEAAFDGAGDRARPRA